jgi:carbonic anhydrase/acetyltransferase-like protein (isoleucine patch superfamily)
MMISYNNKTPVIHPASWVAPDATICGDVTIGAYTRVMWGARVIAEGGQIEIGEYCIIMENAVLRSTTRHPLQIGNHCLIGPNAHVVGCLIEDQVFIATGAAIFHGAKLGKGSEVRINGVVHLKSYLGAGATVPIGWVAVGEPASILPPDQHDKIWAIQEPLNFPLEIYGVDRTEADIMIKVTKRVSEALGKHKDDKVVS